MHVQTDPTDTVTHCRHRLIDLEPAPGASPQREDHPTLRAGCRPLFNVTAADPLRARIGMTSPLAQALLGKRVGGNAVWERPVGNAQLTIEKIEQIDG